MTEIVPFSFDDHNVRVIVDLEGNPWWVASDVCAALGISKARDAVSRLDSEDATTTGIPSAGGVQQSFIVNESGLYDLIFTSRRPEAKRFKRWVTKEVLPEIRKTGSFGLEPMDLPTALEKYAATLREKAAADRRAIEAQSRVVELAPKAVEWDYYMDTGGSCGLAYLGQQLGAGRNRLINRLRELGVLVSKDESQGGVRPMQRYVEQGWFVVKTRDTQVGPKAEAYATPRGVSGVYRLLVQHGVGAQNWSTLPPSEGALLQTITFEE